ncbi:hypothetical protein [Actinoplanes sp. NPDC026619]|uniref:hypothetical protein n=1 Tax=Actinoplanes sp. NPDC026619 TaxID=3155798 RepID=UPI00340C325A
MAADQRLTAVADFVREFIAAETAAARAAVSEPDDDTYAESRGRARSFFAPGRRLTLTVDRSVRPGGRDDEAMPGKGADFGPRVLYAVASLTATTWFAFVSALPDVDGRRIDHALSIAELDGHLLIVGRAAINPFVDTLEWEAAGGAPHPPSRPIGVRIERLPEDPAHAEFLRTLRSFGS